MNKKIGITFLIVVVLVTFAGLAAAECKLNQVHEDPTDPSSSCRDMELEDLGLNKDNCPGCTINNNGEVVLGGSADLSSYKGEKKIVVNLNGNKLIPPPEGISGKGTCDVQNGKIIKCTLEGQGKFGNDLISGNIEYSGETGKFTCTGTECKVDGMTAHQGDEFIYDRQSKKVTITKGHVAIDPISLLGFSVSTRCGWADKALLPSCSAVTPEGEHIYNEMLDFQIRANGYLLSTGTIVRKVTGCGENPECKDGRVLYSFSVSGVPRDAQGNIIKQTTLYGHDGLDCSSSPTTLNCMSIREGPPRKMLVRLSLGYNQFLFSEEYPFQEANVIYSAGAGSAYLNMVEFQKGGGKKLGEIEFRRTDGGKYEVLEGPPAPPSLKIVMVTDPFGKSKLFNVENGILKCYPCSTPIASAQQQTGSQATSFFSFVGKAWGWITGEAKNPPPPKAVPPPPIECTAAGNIQPGVKVKTSSTFSPNKIVSTVKLPPPSNQEISYQVFGVELPPEVVANPRGYNICAININKPDVCIDFKGKKMIAISSDTGDQANRRITAYFIVDERIPDADIGPLVARKVMYQQRQQEVNNAQIEITNFYNNRFGDIPETNHGRLNPPDPNTLNNPSEAYKTDYKEYKNRLARKKELENQLGDAPPAQIMPYNEFFIIPKKIVTATPEQAASFKCSNLKCGTQPSCNCGDGRWKCQDYCDCEDDCRKKSSYIKYCEPNDQACL